MGSVTDSAGIAPSLSGGTAVPAVVGRPREEARRLLQEAGFQVNEVVQLDCRLIGRTTATEPAPGTPVTPGSTITLKYSDAMPNASCAYTAEEHAWEFLDWARGRGDGRPMFAPDLGAPTVPPAGWKDASKIANAASSLLPTVTGQQQPTLIASDGRCPPTADCFAESWIDVRLELAGEPYAAFRLLLDRHGWISDYGLVTPPHVAPTG